MIMVYYKVLPTRIHYTLWEPLKLNFANDGSDICGRSSVVMVGMLWQYQTVIKPIENYFEGGHC